MEKHKGIWGSVALDLPHSFVFQLGLRFCLFYQDLVAVYGNRERKVSATTIEIVWLRTLFIEVIDTSPTV